MNINEIEKKEKIIKEKELIKRFYNEFDEKDEKLIRITPELNRRHGTTRNFYSAYSNKNIGYDYPSNNYFLDYSREFLEYACAGGIRKINNTWVQSNKHTIILGKEFLDVFSDLLDWALNIVKLENDATSYVNFPIHYFYNLTAISPLDVTQHYVPIKGHLDADSLLLGPDCLVYGDKLFERYFINSNVGFTFSIPMFVKNVEIASGIDIKPFIQKVLKWYTETNPNTNNIHVVFVLAFLAVQVSYYLGEYLSKEELKIIEKWTSYIIASPLLIGSTINYLYAKYIPSANIKLHQEILEKYALIGKDKRKYNVEAKYLYRFALEFIDKVDLESIIEVLYDCKRDDLVNSLMQTIKTKSKTVSDTENVAKSNDTLEFKYNSFKEFLDTLNEEEAKIISLKFLNMDEEMISSNINIPVDTVREIYSNIENNMYKIKDNSRKREK